MKNTTLLTIGAFLLIGSLPGTLTAQEDPARVWTGRFALTAEQQARLQEIRSAHRAENDETRAELIRLQAEVQALRAEPDVDLRQLEQALNRLSQLENARSIRQVEQARELAGILTGEQREQFGARALIGRGIGYDRLQVARRPARFDTRFAGRGRGMGSGRGAGYGRGAGFGRTVGSGLGVGYGRGIGFNRNGWSGRGGRGAWNVGGGRGAWNVGGGRGAWNVGGGRGAGRGFRTAVWGGTGAARNRLLQQRVIPPDEDDLTGYRRQYLGQGNLQDRPFRRSLRDSIAAWSRVGRGRGAGRIIPPER